MKKVIIFPYHADIEILVKQKGNLSNTMLLGVASYVEDSCAVNRINDKLGFGVDGENYLVNADTLLVLDNYRGCVFSKYYEIIDKFSIENKKILLTPLAESELLPQCRKWEYKKLESYPYVDEGIFRKMQNLGSKKYEIDIPVIAVMSQGKHCGKFENTLAMKQKLSEQGYNVMCFTSNALGALFGCYTIPGFIFNNGYTFEEKIIKFNNYIYNAVCKEKSDVLLISIPEGITAFSKGDYNHFCEYPLIISNAMQIDAAILCTYFMDDISMAGIQKLHEYCIIKYGIPIKAISVSRTKFDPVEAEAPVKYNILSYDLADSLLPQAFEVGFPVINLINKDDADKKFEYVISRLQSNMDVV